MNNALPLATHYLPPQQAQIKWNLPTITMAKAAFDLMLITSQPARLMIVEVVSSTVVSSLQYCT